MAPNWWAIALAFFPLFSLALRQLGDAAAAADDPYKQARQADLVVNLPGQPNVSFAQYAGYVTVNESHGRALFYWFFEATSNSSSKPLLLWLNGGPGCSSVGYGEAEELGPFRVNSDGASVSFNKYSWNTEVNLVFIESPAGVGFSYSNTTSDYYEFGDSLTAMDSFNFLLGWFERFPEYKTYDFYIAGESYAGHYVPELAKLIIDMNDIGKSSILLKGILIGNAAINDLTDTKGIVDFAWSHAIVSDAFYRNVTMACNGFVSENVTALCNNLLFELFNDYTPINIYDIYADVCLNGTVGPLPTSKKSFTSLTTEFNTGRFSTMKFPNAQAGGYEPCITNYVYAYLNRPDVQQALHANTTNITYEWTSCSNQLQVWTDSPLTLLPTLKQLMALGMRVWIFSGDMDGRIPVLSTRYSVEALNLPTEIDWSPWYHKQQVAGWTQVYKGMILATVRGAGHMVPTFQPARALALLQGFLSGKALPNSP